jgi:uncharacterized protein (DUF1810 family)
MDYNLSRFIKAQGKRYAGYARALTELSVDERKSRHWIWYVFPQLKQLGRSSKARYYGISTIEEASAYLSHPVLGKRLIEIAETLASIDENDAAKILGSTDAMKVKSCMTLFLSASPGNKAFQAVIDKFYNGETDCLTLEILAEQSNNIEIPQQKQIGQV